MDEKRVMRALMISDRLYSKLKARARQLSRERRSTTTYSQVINELLESMEAPPDWTWEEPSAEADEEPDATLAAA
jgi:hypothetical protein